jgi:hypothetical protein
MICVYKCAINLIINPNPICSLTLDMWQTVLYDDYFTDVTQDQTI